jgi:hypothetical protein
MRSVVSEIELFKSWLFFPKSEKVRKFRCLLTTTQRAQVFLSFKFGFLLLAEVQTTY